MTVLLFGGINSSIIQAVKKKYVGMSAMYDWYLAVLVFLCHCIKNKKLFYGN